jgi:hypothetical protein
MTTVLWVLVAAISALLLTVFQYYYKNKAKKRYHAVLSALRFLSIFCGLLLLINPKYTKNELFIEKAKLLILVDNSSSMLQNSEADSLLKKIKKIQDDSRIKEQFDLTTFTLGSNLSDADTMDFEQKTTNISQALEKISNLFSSTKTSVVLVTDGNQTTGKDYEFSQISDTHEVWPLVVGDTTKYQDLEVAQVNLNKYAFLDNQFPVECIINNQGKKQISAFFKIFFDGNLVHREQLIFKKEEQSKTITTLIKAKKVGIKSITVSIDTLENEKNTANNQKETAIEVVDEKTKVLLVTELTHPDVGALKQIITSNEQRTIEIVDPKVDLSQYENTDIAIVYQPRSTHETIYKFIEDRKIPSITIIGTHTDLQWVNRMNKQFFQIELGYPTQEVFGQINSSFPHFDVSTFNYASYPPLSSKIGPIAFSAPHDPILEMSVKGVALESPLATIFSKAEVKKVFLFGENLWKWRMQNHRDTGDFGMIDSFVGKLMVYLSNSGKRNPIEVEYQKVYDGSQEAKIRATFYDKTFALNNRADATIQIKGNNDSFSRNVPMLSKNTYFEADLTYLQAGEYNFTIKENSENISTNGSFKILDFEPENQFFSANHEKLARLGLKTGGKLFFDSQLDDLLLNLLQHDKFVPIQKNNQKIVPLIDFRWLLGFLAFTLSAEWFIRKYNGLL